jgi:hypothetical protein
MQAREEVAAERALYLEALVSHPCPPLSDLHFRVRLGGCSDQIWRDAAGGVRGGGGHGGGVPRGGRCWRRQEAQLLPTGSFGILSRPSRQVLIFSLDWCR